jgi:bifunctional non-homologous end joining protein LigD
VTTGSLADYRKKRRPGRTPEPLPDEGEPPAKTPAAGPGRPSFVIQEHHATSLHWDFRLEHDGVLASWALPKGLPVSPDENHLAVQVEDHPLEYGTFSGTIPEGEYGAGEVSIWDRGRYDCEKWRPREVMVVLHGKRAKGRYVLFPTKGKNWMIHRMDPAPEGFQPLPTRMQPMLATPGRLPPDDDGWAYEFKWDGMRVLLWIDGGRPRALSRNDNDVTGSFPELRAFAEAMGSHQALFDGELVVLGADGRPSFGQLQHRMHASSPTSVRKAAASNPVSLVIFDLLHLDGVSLLGLDYDRRRAALEDLGLAAAGWAVTPSFTSDKGTRVFQAAVDLGMEGVVAKRRKSPYQPGRRSHDWIKVKHQHMQEVVIGGFTEGNGSRQGEFGALLLGLPSTDGRRLTFVGKVGTGFSDRSRAEMASDLKRMVRATSPFDGRLPAAVEKAATWVTPRLVGEVRFSEWTGDGNLRHPVWRGRRPDKLAKDVRREP